MNSFQRITFCVFCSLLMVSCVLFEPSPRIPSVPLLYFNFNGDNNSSGIEPFKIFGNQKMSYVPGIKDSCLNLSRNSFHRKPIVIQTKGQFIHQQQNALSVMVWIKMEVDDNETYAIIGNKGVGEAAEKGWVISSTVTGSWKFEVSDGYNYYQYQATHKRQRINDGKWHMLGFTMDKSNHVARTYFDGRLVGVLSLPNLMDFEGDYHLFIGCDPSSKDYTMDTFNGMMDEVGIWSQKLSDKQFKSAYLFVKEERMTKVPDAEESIRVMTWNIWNGGKQLGKTVGLEKIAKCIADNQADIITLQEDFGSGEYIADKLGYYFYRRSNNLSLLSRFPLGRNYNVFKPINAGGIEVLLDEERRVVVCPLWLNFKPNIRGLLVNGDVNTDTILNLENSTRGSEVTFVLSELNQLFNGTSSVSMILAGDFNSGSHLDWTEENRENKYNKVIPFPATEKMEQNGFIDAYREIWPNELESPGLTYSPIFQDEYNDRIDFMFYKGEGLKAISATVIDSTSTLFPSDHAAVLVTFQLQ